MANPQLEDGKTEIANSIMDALCRFRIPGEERQVLDCIFRKTYGWHKTEDAISLSQFVGMTGMNKPHIIKSIKGLLLKKVIIVTEKGNAPAKLYKINKDFDQWNPLPKKVTLPKKVISVTEKGNSSLPKKVPTKATTTKATTTKAINNNKAKSDFVFCLPDWMPAETWSCFTEMRCKIKKPITPYAEHLIIFELQRIKEKHNHDPVEVINQSIRNNYQDVYPLKKDGGNNGNSTGSRYSGSTKQVTGKAKSDNEPYPVDVIVSG